MTRTALSLGSLAAVAILVLMVFAVAFGLAEGGAPPPPPAAAAESAAERPPEIVGTVTRLSQNTLIIDTAQGKRAVTLDPQAAVRLPDGLPGGRGDLRPGARVAIFGAPVDTQTFRADAVVLLPP